MTQTTTRLGVLFALVTPLALASAIYDSIPDSLPPNVPSVGYAATSTKEFGGLIQFASDDRTLTAVTVVMSNHSFESSWEMVGASAGFFHSLTLNLYSVGEQYEVGNLIAARTVNAFVPWRSEPDATCPNPTAWRSADGGCFSGHAFPVVFDFSGVAVPDRIIYGLAFNTHDHGYTPIQIPGAYDALNFGVAEVPPGIGMNPLPGTAYWNTTHGPFYADDGASGTGIFRQDTNWAPYSGAIRFEVADAPEPGTWALGLTGAGLVTLLRRRRQA